MDTVSAPLFFFFAHYRTWSFAPSRATGTVLGNLPCSHGRGAALGSINHAVSKGSGDGDVVETAVVPGAHEFTSGKRRPCWLARIRPDVPH